MASFAICNFYRGNSPTSIQKPRALHIKVRKSNLDPRNWTFKYLIKQKLLILVIFSFIWIILVLQFFTFFSIFGHFVKFFTLLFLQFGHFLATFSINSNGVILNNYVNRDILLSFWMMLDNFGHFSSSVLSSYFMDFEPTVDVWLLSSYVLIHVCYLIWS